MLLSAVILYAVFGLLVGALNYLVEEGDPANEYAHWLVIVRSIGIGLIWLPYTLLAIRPRRRSRLAAPAPHLPDGPGDTPHPAAP